MKRFLFAIIALITASIGSWAETTPTTYGLSTGTSEHGTLKFSVDGNEVTEAAENAEVIVTINAATGWQVSGVTAEVSTTWGNATARPRTSSTSSIPFANITPTKVDGTTNQWKFTMPPAAVKVSATYSQLTLTVKADNKTISYGAAKPTYTATITGFIDGDDVSKLSGTLSFTCKYTKGSNTGKYTITPKGLTSDKYDIKFVSGTLTVNKAQGNVTFSPWKFEKTFGDPDFIITPSVSDGGSVTYSSNNTDIATVDKTSGKVSIKGIGIVMITAAFAGNENYTSARDWYQVTISPRKQAFSIDATGKTTLCSPDPLEFAEGEDENLKAFTVIGYDYDKQDILLNRVYDVPAGTPLLVTGEEGEYELTCPTKSDAYFENNLLVGNISGEPLTIEETFDPDKDPDDPDNPDYEDPDPDNNLRNYYMKDGTFVQVEGQATIDNGKCYLQLPMNVRAAAPGSTQDVKLNANGKATLCSDVDLDFTDVEGLKAYVVTGYDTSNMKLWLSRVMKVSAKTPLLLKGEADMTYSVPSAGVQSHYENMLVGNTSGSELRIEETFDPDEDPENPDLKDPNPDNNLRNYYLKGAQFLKVNEYALIANGKCYLQLPVQEEPAAARMMEDLELDTCENDEVIAIGIGEHGTLNMEHGALIIEDSLQSDEPRYNLSGQRVSKSYKGMIIIKGQKKITK